MMIKFAIASIFVVAAVSASFSPPQFMQFMQKHHPEMLSKLVKRQTTVTGTSTPNQGALGLFASFFTQALQSINDVSALGQKTILGGINSAQVVAQSSITGIDEALKIVTGAVNELKDHTIELAVGPITQTKKKREDKQSASVVAENRVLGQLFASSAALVGKTINDAQKEIINIAIHAGESTDGTIDDVTSLTLDFVSALAAEFDAISQNLLVASTSPSVSEQKVALEEEAEALKVCAEKLTGAIEPLLEKK